MRAQTAEQKVALSIEIEHMLNNELAATVKHFIGRYRKVLNIRMGMTEDDIVNEVRIQIWKGLITWDGTRKANKKTYVSTLIRNRFFTLFERSHHTKYSKVDYCDDVYSDTVEGGAAAAPITTVTGETLLEKRQEMLDNISAMTYLEEKIYGFLLVGYSLREMVAATGLSRVEVISGINRVNAIVEAAKEN